jgi:hypothetical protein
LTTIEPVGSWIPAFAGMTGVGIESKARPIVLMLEKSEQEK